MLWITKYKHNKIVAEYQKAIDELKAALNRRDDIVKILDRVTDESTTKFAMASGTVGAGDIMSCLDETVPRYTDDYFGGKVIRQEASPVTILDNKGKAIMH